MQQRPHHLVDHFARMGYLSLFCSPKYRGDQFEGFLNLTTTLLVRRHRRAPWAFRPPILLVCWVDRPLGNRPAVPRSRCDLRLSRRFEGLAGRASKPGEQNANCTASCSPRSRDRAGNGAAAARGGEAIAARCDSLSERRRLRPFPRGGACRRRRPTWPAWSSRQPADHRLLRGVGPLDRLRFGGIRRRQPARTTSSC